VELKGRAVHMVGESLGDMLEMVNLPMAEYIMETSLVEVNQAN